ncbi:MAG: hypothetical protein ACFB14_06140 [Leptolyngbyaceae cyanobacterium]
MSNVGLSHGQQRVAPNYEWVNALESFSKWALPAAGSTVAGRL